MERTKTVTDAKAAFIRSQIRLLSAILEPSSAWRESAAEPDEGNLNDKVVDDVMTKVNAKLKQHNRMVYSAQSQRHVAEQIDALYWNTLRKVGAETETTSLVVDKDCDLTNSEAIKTLPEDYSDLHLHQSAGFDEAEAARYKELYDRLNALNNRRNRQRQRLAQYRQLQSLLQPFTNAQENIQPNLVVKDGELAKELDRMRILLARVTGRITEVRDQGRLAEPETRIGSTDEQMLADVMQLT